MKWLKYMVIGPVRLYQLMISPLLGNHCRYTPSCSQYMVEAVSEWGIFRGLLMGLRRIGSCHPWGDHGHDPVPKRKSD